MLATRGVRVPSGDDWVHEVKWDGMRLLAEVERDGDGARVVLTSRLGNEATVAFPELQGLAALVTAPGAPGRLLLDGEVVAMENGTPSFAALAERLHVSRASRAAQLAARRPATFLIFDLLRVDGADLTGRPLRERRALLESLVPDGPNWQVPPGYPDGEALLQATRESGLEGVVSKRLDSRYEPGVRSAAWLKFPHRDIASWVVGGWRHQTDSAVSLGALLVGEPTAAGLRYRGRVGSGLGAELAEALRVVLGPLARPDSPFCDEVPAVDAAGAVWVDPLLVVDVASLGLTPAGRLRQPSLSGPRPDLTPSDLE